VGAGVAINGTGAAPLVGAKHRQVERQGHLVETFRDDRASRQQTDAPRGVIDRALAEMLQRATEIPLGDFPKVPVAVNRFLACIHKVP
jgi:hypothetical protein